MIDETIIQSSGNVFQDLELEDSDELLIKAKLASRISSIIEKRGLTQVQAANILGADQPKVSALLNGRLDGFSIERLIRFLRALNIRVDLTFTESKAS